MQKVTTFLWFDNQAEEAAKFYTSLLPNSRIVEVSRYGEGAPQPKGTAMVVAFTLDGQEYHALNGGPHYQLTPAVSLAVKCDTQEEVDRLWAALTADGGEPVQCGWLKDRYGLSWQIVPTALPRLLQDPDPEKAKRVMQAMLQMVKLDVAALENA
jgi:predicted 3-demethylubiquinone-9 3-methyltransferase (glyoxalase superfamily)